MAQGYAQILLSGGLINGAIYAGANNPQQYGVITIEGNNFAINGSSVGYGILDTGGQSFVHGTLTGNFAKGGLLNNEFYIYGDSSIILIPEPATLILLGLGAAMVKRKH